MHLLLFTHLAYLLIYFMLYGIRALTRSTSRTICFITSYGLFYLRIVLFYFYLFTSFNWQHVKDDDALYDEMINGLFHFIVAFMIKGLLYFRRDDDLMWWRRFYLLRIFHLLYLTPDDDQSYAYAISQLFLSSKTIVKYNTTTPSYLATTTNIISNVTFRQTE
jgi:hypothetical protein